jgi:hypothetical protein
VPAREIYDGNAGTRFVNDTGKVLYQFIASLHNTCALCLQYHLKISFAWPIPMHYGCRCIQREIEPGEKAPYDFVNYRELLKKMPHDQQVAAMGASNYKLLESGLVQWEDIVTENRVRDFREVVARKRLTVKEMTAHGVKKYQAEEAYRSVHTAAHQAAEQHRQQLLNNLSAAGMSQEALVRELSSRLAERVKVAPGPTGPYTAGPAWSGGTVPVPGHVEELAALLKGFKPPPPPPGSAPPPAPTGPRPSSGPATAAPALQIAPQNEEKAESAARGLFGDEAIPLDIARVAGATSEATAQIHAIEGGQNAKVAIEIRSPRYEALRNLYRAPDGKIVMEAKKFNATQTGQGVGAVVFGNMVESAGRLGVDRIRTHAERTLKANGYYTWARFRYDADLPADLAAKLPADLARAKRVSDLMTTPGGVEWWKEHGTGLDMVFDLKPGSRSMQIWEEYRRQKTAAPSNPTSAPPTSGPPTGPGKF